MGEEAFAKEVGLRYVNCVDAGFMRKGSAKRFYYVDAKGKRLSDKAHLARIKSLVIPPAWKDVWICAQANGHLQCTGRDVRGRKQYRYHPDWSKGRNDTKFSKLERFGKILPDLRKRVNKDLARPAMDRDRVLAAVVELMERTGMRVGNDTYAEENDSYGATTIRNKHAKVSGSTVKICFRGKSGVAHDLKLNHARLAKIIRRCQDLPGQELFAYEDEKGKVHDVGSADVNEYLREACGDRVTAKDIRTWVGSVRAIEALWKLGKVDYEALTKKALKERECSVIKGAAEFLGNTVAVCRKYYVHPGVFEADRAGSIHGPRA
ncbi:MAG: DNA topoisomerase IB, partial [Proteobacteria bacterium]